MGHLHWSEWPWADGETMVPSVKDLFVPLARTIAGTGVEVRVGICIYL